MTTSHTLPEQSPGQMTIDEALEEAAIASPEAPESLPPPVRQVIVLPGQYSFNDEILETEMGQFVEFGYGTPIHGGQLYFNRSQLLAIGSEMLQKAGKMTPPKVLAKAEKAAQKLAEGGLSLPVGADVKGLVDPAGRPL